MAAKRLSVADTREHEQARRLEDACAENCFVFGHNVAMLTADPQSSAGATGPVERERGDAGAGHDRQIPPLKRWEEVAMDNAEALTVLGIEIDIAGTTSYGRTDIFENLVPHLLARLEEPRRQGIRLGHRLDVHGTIHAAVGAGCFPRTSLDFLKDRPEPSVVPPVAARVGPLIEVARMAPDPDHRVDAAGPAEDLSPRPVDHAVRGSGLRDRPIGPIDIRAERRWPKHGALQSRPTDIGAPGLDQQD